MGPDRFDDVEYRVLEEPEPPRRPRVRRWTLTALAVVVASGAASAGASALTGDPAAPAAKASHERSSATFSQRDHHDCDKGERRRNSEVKY